MRRKGRIAYNKIERDIARRAKKQQTRALYSLNQYKKHMLAYQLHRRALELAHKWRRESYV